MRLRVCFVWYPSWCFCYLHDRYFREVGQIARLQTRLQTFHYKLVYEDKVREVKDGIAKLNAAVESICDSDAFKRLLEVVLTFGNFLNQGSFRGNAQGVKINFLNEMKSTKVSNSTSATTSTILSQDSTADHNGMVLPCYTRRRSTSNL
eukprot:COSAG02_NODE_18112_length_960_cov_1.457607_1_plen_149_part_00